MTALHVVVAVVIFSESVEGRTGVSGALTGDDEAEVDVDPVRRSEDVSILPLPNADEGVESAAAEALAAAVASPGVTGTGTGTGTGTDMASLAVVAAAMATAERRDK